jgi:hypothetical protein
MAIIEGEKNYYRSTNLVLLKVSGYYMNTFLWRPTFCSIWNMQVVWSD